MPDEAAPSIIDSSPINISGSTQPKKAVSKTKREKYGESGMYSCTGKTCIERNWIQAECFHGIVAFKVKNDILILEFSPFPNLFTKRLILREISFSDAELIHELRSDSSINALIDRENSKGVEDAILFIDKIKKGVSQNECIYWIICLENTSELIGTIGCWNFDLSDETAEIGYELLAKFRGNGIMTEILPEIMRFGFEKMKLKLIIAFTSEQNIGSVKLLGKFGFQLTAPGKNNPLENVSGLLKFLLQNPASIVI